jgi:hypothetical protein
MSKMAKKALTAKAKRTAKPQVTRKASKPHVSRRVAESKRSEADHPDVENREVDHEGHLDRGAPMEHFRGERNRGERTGDAGSLDEETLDRDAPYNRTYGRVESDTAQ